MTWFRDAKSIVFQVIQSIALNDLEVTLEEQDQTFAPPTSSKFTLAKYKNPFGFSLQVIEAGENIVLDSQGVDVAQVKITSHSTCTIDQKPIL